jgi:hypothetical protein
LSQAKSGILKHTLSQAQGTIKKYVVLIRESFLSGNHFKKGGGVADSASRITRTYPPGVEQKPMGDETASIS